MAKKKTGVLTRRVHELEDAVVRLFTGEGPAQAASKRAKSKNAVKPVAKKLGKKTTKKAAKKAPKRKRASGR